MKQFTEAELKALLERAYRMGWRKAVEPIDNVFSSIIAWNASPDDFINEVEELLKEV